MQGLAYFTSASGNTGRFIDRLGLPAFRLGAGADPSVLRARPFVLVCPSYSDGEGRGAVPKPVIRALNDPAIRAQLLGVIGAGNRNFGPLFGHAGRVIAEKCNVPLLYRFELAGTETDLARVRGGLAQFRRA
ncbi:class Ib ribonucleoside-diphosphate reductase assembly flavoprotein NrdI [Poseidonocella sp. HB161398]|uniref:class Ib ribonucleoside-diphosphate reductase assembly flavoprotein NrdI n=1 Tax=Poseidonocella sp. HB161398 TaxID=2320855 RepID=UPI00110A08F1|nr:class Ib ribonucleoside-diphosphate reductase assembly flavoprotein NrdI [Poseidonocella sp. HB161398]